MAYLLNSVDLATFGVVPGRIGGGSNIALDGCFDFPKRIGDIDHSWGDEHGNEPYLLEDEMFFGGRDIVFNGHISGSRSSVYSNISSLYTHIDTQASGTVVFSTPYGDFNTYIKSIMPHHYIGISEISMTLREPVVTLTGGSVRSAASGDTYTIDGAPMNGYGLYFSNGNDLYGLPEMKEQKFTKIEAEGYKISKRLAGKFNFTGFVAGSNLTAFTANIKNLYALYSSPGEKVFDLNGDITLNCYMKHGFKIEDVFFYNAVIGKFRSELTIISIE